MHIIHLPGLHFVDNTMYSRHQVTQPIIDPAREPYPGLAMVLVACPNVYHGYRWAKDEWQFLQPPESLYVQ